MLGCPGDPRIACRRSRTSRRAGRSICSTDPGVTMSSSTVDPADPVFELHRGGKMAVASTVPLTSREDLSLAYTPGVARVCEAIAADPALADDYTWVGAHRRGGHRRLGRARPGQHRPARRDAGDGGQGGAVQAVRRRRRGADLPGHPGHRRDRRDRHGARARRSAGSTWRTSPRRAASRSSGGSTRRWTSRSSTTTSTAPRSWCSPRCATPPRCSTASSATCGWWSAAPARPASR